ncbi:hypothetical protein ACJ41O_006935 [Fusarium nematophilum]
MAIYNDAFVARFTSYTQVLYPKNPLEAHIDYVALRWDKSMMQKPIFPLEYNVYRRLWHRDLEVAGLREDLRPYSMRVGAGGRLDGALEPALRSYIMGNTEDVFRKSYNPVDQRKSLTDLAYKELAGGSDETISKLHQSFTKRDCYAPIYITEEDLKEFESRHDIINWRKELESFPSRDEAKRIRSKIQYVKNTLEKKLIKKRRAEYFDAADCLRSKGLSTSHLHQAGTANPRFKQNGLSSGMAQALAPYFLAEDDTEDFADRLVAYLRQVPDLQLLSDSEPAKPKTAPPARSRCLICHRTFANRSALTRHVTSTHDEYFREPFHCPEWRFLEQKILVPAGPAAWSNHAERYHGKLHAPNTSPAAEKRARCLLCENNYTVGGFNLHLGRAHRQLGHFATCFTCPECQRHGTGDVLIENEDQWMIYIRAEHGGGKIPGAVITDIPGKQVKTEGAQEAKLLSKKRQSDGQKQCRQIKKKKVAEESEDAPYKQVKPWDWPSSPKPASDLDWDWKAECARAHDGEEFWVTGYDGDYDEVIPSMGLNPA